MFEHIFAFLTSCLNKQLFMPFCSYEIFNTYDNELAAHICVELAKEVMWRLGLTLPEVKSLFVVTEHISHELHLSLTYSLAWFCCL